MNSDLKRLIERMRRHELHLFTYLKHSGIPPDNNAAERVLRPLVIMRKTSYDFKSEEVMDSFASYISLLLTCKKHGMDFGEALHLLLLGKITPVLKVIGF
ncbi:MAG: IS66 family transposase [Promethearchaeota archaeon]